jgi:hypothetical protein
MRAEHHLFVMNHQYVFSLPKRLPFKNTEDMEGCEFSISIKNSQLFYPFHAKNTKKLWANPFEDAILKKRQNSDHTVPTSQLRHLLKTSKREKAILLAERKMTTANRAAICHSTAKLSRNKSKYWFFHTLYIDY